MSNTKDSRVVVIGGGTGSFMLLKALKTRYKNITALVNMADDGGSTGMLRDELGVLPPGDIRQCLVALSRSPKVRDLFDYRFEEGTLTGHSFGNLFLTALEKVTGNFAEAVETASKVLNIEGQVVPITLNNVRLVLENANGSLVKGERNIDIMHFASATERPHLSLEPRAAINPVAKRAIEQADLIVFAPGDLYTSLGPSLIVDGVGAALAGAKAQKVYICNLVVKPGQTAGFDVTEHALEIERFAGGPILETVIYNTAKPPKDLFEKYARDGEYLVEINEPRLVVQHFAAVGRPLLSSKKIQVNAADSLAGQRSLIRHDGLVIADIIAKL